MTASKREPAMLSTGNHSGTDRRNSRQIRMCMHPTDTGRRALRMLPSY